MQVFKTLRNIPSKFKNCFVSVGVFDGVHLGHRKLLKQLIINARRNKTLSLVITFDKLPQNVILKKKEKLITSLNEKIKLLREIGVDGVLVLPFTKGFSRLSASEFINKYIKCLSPKGVVVGKDFRFGRDGKNFNVLLKRTQLKFNCKVINIAHFTINKKKISSTKIRKLILKGAIENANSILGAPFTITGKVIKAKGIGKRLLFPTANIKVAKEKILPKGVFIVKVKIKDRLYFGIANIGRTPTITPLRKRKTPEVFIFNFTKKIYNQNIKVFLLKRIRSERKFDSLIKLKKAIQNDITYCKKILERIR